jgi:hypothetical protein
MNRYGKVSAKQKKIMSRFFSISIFRSQRVRLLVLLCFPFLVFSQDVESTYLNKNDKGYVVHAIIDKGDTLPYVWLPWLSIQTEMPFKNRKQYVEWTRIRNNVKKVYPYAILAAAKLKEYDLILAKMPDEKMRAAYLRVCDKELRKEFMGELKELSVNQGRILMKLIDRETGKTTYTIVKELRGNFQAFMWQSLTVLFGNTMKQEYDAAGEDKLIEVAIHQIESGQF